MHRPIWTIVPLMTATALALSVPAIAKRPSAAYPEQLLGVWEGGYEPCKFPGNLDSDARIEIQRSVLNDYEQHNKPVHVIQVSSKPLAWKIGSILYADGQDSSQSEIYVLNGSGQLTIVDESRTEIYTRCE